MMHAISWLYRANSRCVDTYDATSRNNMKRARRILRATFPINVENASS